MPHSWIRIPNGASPAVRRCMETKEGSERERFESCVDDIVQAHDGGLESIYYEPNGRWARIHFVWANVADKTAIVYELQGEDEHYLLTREEVEMLDELGK
jgi:hypothetical protein